MHHPRLTHVYLVGDGLLCQGQGRYRFPLGSAWSAIAYLAE